MRWRQRTGMRVKPDKTRIIQKNSGKSNPGVANLEEIHVDVDQTLS
jgi:hypothetical protein